MSIPLWEEPNNEQRAAGLCNGMSTVRPSRRNRMQSSQNQGDKYR